MVAIKSYTLQEVEKHNSKESPLIVIDDWVINVTYFGNFHPGGPEIIEEWWGKDATSIFRDPKSHVHGKAAQTLLQKFLVGYIEGKKKPEEIKRVEESKKTANDFGVDLSKGLLFQVTKLSNEKYLAFLESVLVADTTSSLKFFDNDIIELTTKSPWYTVPIVWVPVTLYMLYLAISSGLSLYEVPIFIFLGTLFWHFTEYTLHKHVFHMTPQTSFGRFMHFLLHGYHHLVPMDSFRLTFPPTPAFIIAVFILVPIRAIFPPTIAWALSAGFTMGYMYYDLMHYYLHHAPPGLIYTRSLKTHHLYHHFHHHESNFGISTTVFDSFFNTWNNTMLARKKLLK